MRKLFSPEGERALAAAMRRQPLFAFDFDGTLAPIVARPDDAQVPTGVAQRLARLALLRPVAIITGRSVADVSTRLGFVPSDIVGNHGAEDPSAPAPRHGDTALDGMRQRLQAELPDLRRAGVAVEDKRYSLAFHYRLAKNHEAALRRIEALLDPLDPALKTFGGKCIVNVVAASAPDKGDAVDALVRRYGTDCAVFLGDDVNDEAVFERAPPHWLTVRIGHDSAVRSQARFFIDAHSDVATLLDRMLALLGQH